MVMSCGHESLTQIATRFLKRLDFAAVQYDKFRALNIGQQVQNAGQGV